jgi:uncharacterized membrane protein YidH (DUF202 family)
MRSETAWVRVGNFCLLIFNLAFAVLALFFIFRGGVKTDPSAGLEYKDFVSILLTGLSVMIAIGAIFIAVLAIWSYNHFKTLTEASAEKAASEKAEEMVLSWLSNEAPAVVRKHVDLLTDATLGNGDDDTAADDIGKEAG